MGSIPAEIADLSDLTTLYLNDNQLSGLIPAAIDELPNLKRLDLDRNNSIGSGFPVPEELVGRSAVETALTDRDALEAFYHATNGAKWRE